MAGRDRILTVTTVGIRKIENMVDAIIGAADPDSNARDLGGLMLAENQIRFKAQVTPDGRPWKQSGRAKKRGGPTLFDDGFLFNSLGVSGNISLIGGFGAVEIISNVVGKRGRRYSRFHQDGTRFHISRPFLGFDANDQELMVDFIAARIARAAGNALRG